MSDIAIRFEDVGKLYQLGTVGTGTIAHDIQRWWTTSVLHNEDPYLKIGETNDRCSKGHSDYVYALKDITFDVQQGEVLGIIGKNGAGKSTLLKLLSRVTYPTTGNIYVKGRIASLLEVGTGFHPELTGRENIYMNGSILGMKKHEIDRKLDEIVDFSGCERYLDTPVKRYSSGMMVRLGFAVAAHLEPEILVVDEVLAVGDAEFQKKAIGKMQDVSKGEGRTVLFVSHNMASIKSLCHNGIVLQNGMISYSGSINDCVDNYLETRDGISEFISKIEITDRHRPWDNQIKELEFIEARLHNNPEKIATDEPIMVELTIKVNKRVYEECQYSVNIDDEYDERIMNYVSSPRIIPKEKDLYKTKFTIKNHDLTPRKYWLSFAIGEKDFSRGIRNYDATHHVLSFQIKQVTEGKDYSVWSKNWGAIMHGDQFIEIETSDNV